MSGREGTRVWGVSSGSYSAYRVRCICMTKKDAETVAAKIKGAGEYDDPFVEEFEVVAADVEQVPVLRLTTTLWDDGQESETREAVESTWAFEGYEPRMQWRWVRAPIHRNQGGRLDVSGTDHELVRRTYSDQRAQLIAQDSFRRRTEAKNRVLR